jgi:hypothetical protein
LIYATPLTFPPNARELLKEEEYGPLFRVHGTALLCGLRGG